MENKFKKKDENKHKSKNTNFKIGLLVFIVLVLILIVAYLPIFGKNKNREVNVYSFEEYLHLNGNFSSSGIDNVSMFARENYGEPVKNNRYFEVYKKRICEEGRPCYDKKTIINKKKNKVMEIKDDE